MYTSETKQMMAQGGLKDQGGTTDAVSGNDVPPGALQEEVRDDISAKLSGGEFVLPADIVRYIGLKNLMKLRDEAKMGLKKMEEIGQMGNSKSGAEGEALHGAPEENDEEFSSSIDEIMNSEEGEEKKYQKGGYVPAENKALYANAPIKGFEMIPMENASGNVIYIPFIDGKPQLNIPEGYNIKAKSTAPTTTGTPGAGVSGAGGGSSTIREYGEGSDAARDRASGWANMTAEQRAVEMDLNPNLAKFDAFAMSLVPSGLLSMQQSLNTPGTSPRDIAARQGTAALAAFDAKMSSEQSTRNTLADQMRAAEHATAKTAIDNAIANNTDPEAELGKLAEGMGITTGGLTGTTVGTTGGGFQSSFGSGSVGGFGTSTAESTSNYGNEGRNSLATQSAKDAATSLSSPTASSGAATYGGSTPSGISFGPSGPSVDMGSTVGLGSSSTGGKAGETGMAQAESKAGGSGPSASIGGVTDSSGAAVSDSSGAQVGTTDFGDKGGGGGGGAGCFLTTAAVDHMNEKDDGEVLSTLREFRDTYMKKNKEKSKDVAWYYDNAPKIVKAIDARQDAKSLYTKMYNRYIKKAYRQIKNGDLEEAYTTYKAGIDFAKKSANIKKGFLDTRSSVKDSEVKKVKTGFVPR